MTDEHSCESCTGESCPVSEAEGAAQEEKEPFQHNVQGAIDHRELARSMGRIKHKLIVLSGKGGVGKSTVAVNLATSLALNHKAVGLLDVDLHGPSVPKLLGMEDVMVKSAGHILLPAKYGDLLKVLSLGFMLRHRDDAVIWRGPSKISVIQQYLRDADWGDLDYLVVDSPPGTGDEPLTIAQLIPDLDGAIIVTTPQDVALADVRKSVTFCRKVELPVIGVVENMSNPTCPHCGKEVAVFGSGGGEEMAKQMEVPFLGRSPLDAAIAESGEKGKPFVQEQVGTETSFAFQRLLPQILKLEETKDKADTRGYGEMQDKDV